MGTMTITIETAAKTFSYSRTVSTPHLNRLVVAYRGLLGQVKGGPGGRRDRTNDEVMKAFADGFFDDAKAKVKAQEEVVAWRAVEGGVDEIGMD